MSTEGGWSVGRGSAARKGGRYLWKRGGVTLGALGSRGHKSRAGAWGNEVVAVMGGRSGWEWAGAQGAWLNSIKGRKGLWNSKSGVDARQGARLGRACGGGQATACARRRAGPAAPLVATPWEVIQRAVQAKNGTREVAGGAAYCGLRTAAAGVAKNGRGTGVPRRRQAGRPAARSRLLC